MRFCRRASVVSAAIPAVAPYAEAVGLRGEKINRCGARRREAVMLKNGRAAKRRAATMMVKNSRLRHNGMLAVIDENNCIGCTKCIQACPVDAIVGAQRAPCAHGHASLSSVLGCNLCGSIRVRRTASELRPVNERRPDSWKWDLNTIPVRCIIPVGTTC